MIKKRYRYRFFSRKVKSPDAKSKTPEPVGRAETERIAKPAPIGKSAATRSPTIRVSTVSINSCKESRINIDILTEISLQTDLKVVPPQIPERSGPKAMSVLSGSGVEAIGNEIFDAECLKLMNEYFYGVRIFPGQDPTHVYIGWVTSQYHLHTKDFNLSKVRKSSVVIVDEYDRPVEQ